MSRSLDKDVLENLKSEDPTTVYRDVTEALTSLPQDGTPLEIELLGKAHPLEPGVNYLQDGNAIAIPKLRLTQAFFVARRVLQKHIHSQLKVPSSETVAATAVVLLMDPEHLTAANIRKRYILSALDSNKQPETLVRHEKQFLDSLLTARLHRHTKSPTLWCHRRWLMERFKLLNLPLDMQTDFSSVIMVAAERHPRNYYAWHHARWLTCSGALEPDLNILIGIAANVKDWCFKHHNDISGWTYLGSIIMSIKNEGTKISQCSAIFIETLGMTESFRWTNESVWVFLRTIAAMNFVSEELFGSFLELNKRLLTALEEEAAKRILDDAVRWACQHRQGV